MAVFFKLNRTSSRFYINTFPTIIRNSSYQSTNVNLKINKETKVICQGFTGQHGTLHSKLCLEYGTKLLGGVNPKKGGQKHLGLPVFTSVQEAKEQVDPDATIIFVPATAAARVSTYTRDQNTFSAIANTYLTTYPST